MLHRSFSDKARSGGRNKYRRTVVFTGGLGLLALRQLVEQKFRFKIAHSPDLAEQIS
jgi:hypothetical protein